jgi:hypothetical protein
LIKDHLFSFKAIITDSGMLSKAIESICRNFIS